MPRRTRKPIGIGPQTRICCLTGNEQWEMPSDGMSCTSKRHGHISLCKVEQFLADGKMEMVRGYRVNHRGIEEPAWLPVAKFVNARRWRKTMSVGDGAPMATMQLVAGG